MWHGGKYSIPFAVCDDLSLSLSLLVCVFFLQKFYHISQTYLLFIRNVNQAYV